MRATLPAGESTLLVYFMESLTTSEYTVAVEVPYQTSYWITNKGKEHFTANFGTTSAYDQEIGFLVVLVGT